MTARLLPVQPPAFATVCGARAAPRAGFVAAIGVSALLFAACTSAPTPRVDDYAVARYRETGYRISVARAIETHRISAPASDTSWSASVTRPSDHGAHPIIIYLPSLGQTDEEPNRWVSAWAQAGYAVLVVQPLGDDANVWGTPEARSGDFERAARARFGADPMADRIARLSRLLHQISERSLRGEAGLEGLLWSKVALAGADLGAYTTQTVATTPAASLAQISWPVAPLAYLAISPYAKRSPPVPDSTGTVHAPVLMISSRDDIDADGIVTDTSLRRLAFDRLGAGNDYYLELASATHRWLGGALHAPPNVEPPAHRPTAPLADTEHPGKGGTTAAAREAMAPDSEEFESPAEKSAHSAAAREELVKARSRALTLQALSEVSFAAVSIAFLDAYVRGKPEARSWLDDTASQWLQNGDRLKHR